MKLAIASVLVVVGISSVSVLANPGNPADRVVSEPPSSFVFDVRGGPDEANAVALTQGGGILIAGAAGKSDPNAAQDFALVRVGADGSLDSAFGQHGKMTVDFGGRHDSATSVGVQRDGRIIVVGVSNGPTRDDGTGGTGLAIARLRSDGSLDHSFGGGDGKLRLADRALHTDCLYAPTMQVARNDRIVLAVTTGCGGEGAGNPLGIDVIRLRPDGSRDSGFGKRGIWSTAKICSAPAIAVQRDGGIVVAGANDESFSFHCTNTATVVKRLTVGGRLDRGFGHHGELRFRYPGRAETGASDVTIDRRGRIIIAGYATADADYEHPVRFAVARLTRAGELDDTFGNRGRITVKVGRYPMDLLASVARARGGRLVAAGASVLNPALTESDSGPASDFIVSRFEPNGTLDRSFDDDGRATAQLANDAEASDITLTEDGTLVIVGSVMAKGADPANPEWPAPSDFALTLWRDS